MQYCASWFTEQTLPCHHPDLCPFVCRIAATGVCHLPGSGLHWTTACAGLAFSFQVFYSPKVRKAECIKRLLEIGGPKLLTACVVAGQMIWEDAF